MSDNKADYRPPYPVQRFVENLQKLERGERARLKRNAGNKMEESRGVLGLFYKTLLPAGVPERDEKWYFLVATLYPLAAAGDTGSLGNALNIAQTLENKEGLDRRVERLLDADEMQLRFQLRQAVRFLHSNRVPIDWAQLLSDLLRWFRPSRVIQKQWARDYFSQRQTTEPTPDSAS